MGPTHLLSAEDKGGDIYLTEEALEESKIINRLHVVRKEEAAVGCILKEGRYQEAKMPDSILPDINLLQKNGYEVGRALKSHEDTKMISAIMLTTSSSQKDINIACRYHANSYYQAFGYRRVYRHYCQNQRIPDLTGDTS